MLKHISEADILFHSSLEECMPGPIIEAMALRVPVVAASEASGSEWLLDGGICGKLSSGLDVQSMGKALLESISQKETIRAMVSMAYSRAQYLSRAEYVLEAYNLVYADALRSHNGRQE